MTKAHRNITLVALALACAMLAATAAFGSPDVVSSQSGGPTPVAPAKGKKLPHSRAFTFKARAPKGSSVFVTVSKSKRRDADGILKNDVYFRAMKRSRGLFVKKTERYDALDDYFLNRPGRYYWQAYLIACDGVSDDCKVEGPTRSFRIR